MSGNLLNIRELWIQKLLTIILLNVRRLLLRISKGGLTALLQFIVSIYKGMFYPRLLLLNAQNPFTKKTRSIAKIFIMAP
jgi:hypothetical protein